MESSEQKAADQSLAMGSYEQNDADRFFDMDSSDWENINRKNWDERAPLVSINLKGLHAGFYMLTDANLSVYFG